MRKMLFATLLLAGCASQPVAVQLATACDAYASTINVLAVQRRQGKLSQDDVTIVASTFPIASEVCNGTPPDDAVTAAARVQALTDRLTLMLAQR
jgi:hypothetical protein